MDPGFNSYDRFSAGYTRPWWILPRESTETCCPILLLERNCVEMITLNPAMGEAMMRPARHFFWSWMSMTEAFLRCWLDWQHFATKSTGSMASWWMTCRKKLPKGLLEGRWFEHTSAAYLRLLWSESLGCSNVWMVHDFSGKPKETFPLTSEKYVGNHNWSLMALGFTQKMTSIFKIWDKN